MRFKKILPNELLERVKETSEEIKNCEVLIDEFGWAGPEDLILNEDYFAYPIVVKNSNKSRICIEHEKTGLTRPLQDFPAAQRVKLWGFFRSECMERGIRFR